MNDSKLREMAEEVAKQMPLSGGWGVVYLNTATGIIAAALTRLAAEKDAEIDDLKEKLEDAQADLSRRDWSRGE